MALQSPFFNNNKREGEAGYQPPRTGTTPTTSGASSASSMSTSSASSSAPLPVPAPVTGAESKLTVGPNIKLKGVEITDCDTLVVEGSVEATMDSRVIQISERGAFKGSAEIDIAEIRGVFDGNLTVRQKLTIFATGKVTGRVRYGKIVIEEGGQLSGEIEAGASAVRAAGTAAGNAARPELQQVRTA
ncbi:MAG: polymer-forming cytoskeletal protein [Pseudomonadota bacterium]